MIYRTGMELPGPPFAGVEGVCIVCGQPARPPMEAYCSRAHRFERRRMRQPYEMFRRSVQKVERLDALAAALKLDDTEQLQQVALKLGHHDRIHVYWSTRQNCIVDWGRVRNGG